MFITASPWELKQEDCNFSKVLHRLPPPRVDTVTFGGRWPELGISPPTLVEEAADVMVAQPALPGLGRSAEHVSTALLM
ncbi:unnamed protein product [Gadus morhua 'NCC']